MCSKYSLRFPLNTLSEKVFGPTDTSEVRWGQNANEQGQFARDQRSTGREGHGVNVPVLHLKPEEGTNDSAPKRTSSLPAPQAWGPSVLSPQSPLVAVA